MAGPKTNNMKALRALAPVELGKRLRELRTELAKEHAKLSMTGAPTKTGRIKELRRGVARILTINSMAINKAENPVVRARPQRKGVVVRTKS